MGIWKWSWNSVGVEGKQAKAVADATGMTRMFGYFSKEVGKLSSAFKALNARILPFINSAAVGILPKGGLMINPRSSVSQRALGAADRLRDRANKSGRSALTFGRTVKGGMIKIGRSGLRVGTGGLILPYAVGAVANQIADEIDNVEKLKNDFNLTTQEAVGERNKRVGSSVAKTLLSPVPMMGTAYARLFRDMNKEDATNAVNMIWDDYFKSDLQKKAEHKERERLRKQAQKEVTQIIDEDRKDIANYQPTSFKLGTPSDVVAYRIEMRKLNAQNVRDKERALRFIANRNVDDAEVKE